MSSWTPITAEQLQEIIRAELLDCTLDQRAIFEQHRVNLHRTTITRYGQEEPVFIVARRGNEAMYYEDIENGFNFSPLTHDGRIEQHWCNQDALKFALCHWAPRIEPPPAG